MLLPSAARPSSLRCGGEKEDVVDVRTENSPRWPQGGDDESAEGLDTPHPSLQRFSWPCQPWGVYDERGASVNPGSPGLSGSKAGLPPIPRQQETGQSFPRQPVICVVVQQGARALCCEVPHRRFIMWTRGAGVGPPHFPC